MYRNGRVLAAYLFGAAVLGIVVSAILAATLPDPVTWIFLGAYPVGVAWSIGGFLEWDGTHNKRIGVQAEGLTTDLMKRLKKLGWTAITNVPHKGGDVDLVLLGPRGVFAIETKYTSNLEGFDPDSMTREKSEWLSQARGGAADMKWRLSHLGVKWVHPALVIWGPGVPTFDTSHFTANQVFVAAGGRYREWLDEMLALATDGELPVDAMRKCLLESA